MGVAQPTYERKAHAHVYRNAAAQQVSTHAREMSAKKISFDVAFKLKVVLRVISLSFHRKLLPYVRSTGMEVDAESTYGRRESKHAG